MKKAKAIIGIILLSLLILTSIPPVAAMADDNNCKGQKGITICDVQYRDKKFLEDMLSSTADTLKSLYKISPDSVVANLQKIQGQRVSSTKFGLSFGGDITRKSTSETTGSTADSFATTLGETVTNTVAPEGTASQTQNTGQTVDKLDKTTGSSDKQENTIILNIPSVNASGDPTSFKSSMGISARDLLNDSVNLSFNAVNLQYMLSRGFSDEIWEIDSGRGVHRRNVVVGVKVFIDPRDEHKDCAAIVKCKISNADTNEAAKSGGKIRLLQVFPMEDTYNIVAISEHTTNIGGAIPILPISLAFGSSNYKGKGYLVKDIDTIAFQGENRDNEIVFGWQFRPVLGRKYVKPGYRNVFALVSVPEYLSKDFSQRLQYNIKTHWQKVDQKTGILKDNEMTIPDSGKDGIVKIPAVETVQNYLKPSVIGFIDPFTKSFVAKELEIGGKISGKDKPGETNEFKSTLKFPGDAKGTIVVYVNGYNFSRDICMRAGEKVYNCSTGSIVQRLDDRMLRLILPEEIWTQNDKLELMNDYGSTIITLDKEKKDCSIKLSGKKYMGDNNAMVEGENLQNISRIMVAGMMYDAGKAYSFVTRRHPKSQEEVTLKMALDEGTSYIKKKGSSYVSKDYKPLDVICRSKLIISLPGRLPLKKLVEQNRVFLIGSRGECYNLNTMKEFSCRR